MRIAHISDLHFTNFFKKNNLQKIEQLLTYGNRHKYDHLVISGDLTHNAEAEGFEILRGLFKKYCILNSERLSIVIGNHDIFGGPLTPEDIFLFPEKCKAVDFDNKVKEFGNYFSEAFQYCSRFNNNYFPYAKIINNVFLIGLNSIAEYSKLKNPFASSGKINLKDFILLEKILNKDYIDSAKKLILVHHHFNKIKVNRNKPGSNFWQNIEKQTMKLRNKKKLLQLFKLYNIDLVLHGHIHENREYFRKGIRFFNAGGSVLGTDPGQLKINFINIKPEQISIETHKIPFGITAGTIIKNENCSNVFSIK